MTNLAAAGAAIMAEEKAIEHAIHDLAYQVPFWRRVRSGAFWSWPPNKVGDDENMKKGSEEEEKVRLMMLSMMPVGGLPFC